MTRSLRSVLAFLPAMAIVATGGAALAQTTPPTVSCIDASRPNLIYVAGSTALRPFLGTMAQVLAKETPAYTIVYQGQGSCTGVSAILSDDPAKQIIKDIPAAGGKAANYAIFFKADGSAQECSLDVAGNTVDLGVSDVFAASCGQTAGANVADYYGPIQPMTFVVPAASSQHSISAEAAYLALGLGGAGGKSAPWTDPSLFFVRNASSGTQQMIARAIGVPGERWWGKDRGGSGAVVSGLKVLLTPDVAEKSIGILSSDLADAERNNLRILAFRAKGQDCGFLPDSTLASKDKVNVRDGHYPIWGPVHLFARTSGALPNAAAGAFVTRFATVRVDKTLIDALIDKSLVPQCAMRVSRTSELGALASFSPEFQCGCYFDARTTGASSCKTCQVPADCPTNAPACNLGYCEAK
jgi:ABC-type phosphate transport system substrate-binding protein